MSRKSTPQNNKPENPLQAQAPSFPSNCLPRHFVQGRELGLAIALEIVEAESATLGRLL